MSQLATLSWLCLLNLSGQTHAATSFFTDSASFFAALPGPSSTQDFEGIPGNTGIPDGTNIDGISYSSNVIDTNSAANLTVLNNIATTSGNNSLGGGFDIDGLFLSGNELSFSFSDLTQAFGLFVIGTPGGILENDFLLAAGGNSVFNLETPEQTTFNDTEVYFLGLIDTDGFDSAELISFGDPSNPFFDFIVDDITTVTADAAVPEPSSYLLLSLGLLMLGQKKTCKKI